MLGNGKAAAELLDCIDAMRSCLIGQSCFEEMMEQLPQFVAVGAQSAGKSSVIRRISGVSLPEASGLCTRIATLIQLRRTDTESINVRLIGPTDEPFQQVAPDLPSVRALVEQAQDIALKRCPGSGFVDDHHIQVSISGPTCPNVTLVDLPGFHTADDAGRDTVNAIVKRYVSMKGTLVMHVVKGDQDYASVLGNDFMRKLDSENDDSDRKRITVLTHCDRLLPAKHQSDRERLRSTLQTVKTAFAIQGAAADTKEETSALSHLISVDGLEVGRQPLVAQLEELMQVHVEKQFPIAVDALQRRLVKVKADLESVRERSPMEVAHRLASTVKEQLPAKHRKLLNMTRATVERMSQEIKDYTIRPEGKFTYQRAANDDLFVGKHVMYELPVQGSVNNVDGNDDGRFIVKCTVVSTDPVHLRDARGKQYKLYIPEDRLTRVYLLDRCKPVDLFDEIEQFAADRGMRNLEFVDRHQFIVKYAGKFAEHYTAVTQKAVKEVQQRVSDMYDDLFATEGIPEVAQAAATHMRKLIKKGEMIARDAMAADIAKLKAFNTDPDLVFTTNDHYLEDLIDRMSQAEEKKNNSTPAANANATTPGAYAGNNGSPAANGNSTPGFRNRGQRVPVENAQPATSGNRNSAPELRRIYYSLCAYIKVQRKAIVEEAAKMLVKNLVLDTKRYFDEVCSNELQTCADRVNEPARMGLKRDELNKQKAALENALQQAPRWMHY